MAAAGVSQACVRLGAIMAGAALLSACASSVTRPPDASAPGTGTRPGGYYLDDGPESNPPADLDSVPDAQPRVESIRVANTRPYTAMGRTYVPMTALQPYSETGVASWYGKRYNGQPTASGEIYDMYAMTAAHPTLPIPSYARVTRADGTRSVVVRINDRGPFHSERVIDLSYTAAYKLAILADGSARVRVESILPGHGRDRDPLDGPSGAVRVGAGDSARRRGRLRRRQLRRRWHGLRGWDGLRRVLTPGPRDSIRVVLT
jgi:rare lipoprotein A